MQEMKKETKLKMHFLLATTECLLLEKKELCGNYTRLYRFSSPTTPYDPAEKNCTIHRCPL